MVKKYTFLAVSSPPKKPVGRFAIPDLLEMKTGDKEDADGGDGEQSRFRKRRNPGNQRRKGRQVTRKEASCVREDTIRKDVVRKEQSLSFTIFPGL